MSDDLELATNLITRVNIGDALTRTAGRLPTQPALVDGERRWTYDELNTHVNRVANGLRARGYVRGDALALASGNSAEFLITYFACAKLGLVCVPMNLGWRADEIAYVLDHSEARGIVVEAQLLPLVQPAVEKVPAVADIVVAPGTGGSHAAELPDRTWATFADLEAGEPVEPEVFVGERDAISYLYTSGTTSFPKGVIGSHVAIYLESLMAAAETAIGPDDRIACVMPLFHTAQLNGFGTSAVMMGATQYLMRAFDPTVMLDTIERERITRAFVLPMMWRMLADDPSVATRDLSCLRKAAYAMAPMPDALLRKCIDTFKCDFYLAFGQTEMSPVTTFFRPEHQLSHSGAVGTQVVNVQIGIMAQDGTLLPPRPGRRDRLSQPAGAQRVPEEPRGHSGGVRARLVPLRRRRNPGRRRDAVVQRPLQGRHQVRRGERGLDRGREGPLRRVGRRGRGRHRRPAPRTLDRGHHRRRRGQARQRDRPRLARHRHAQPHCLVQAAQIGDRRRRAAQDLDGKDPEERRAQAVHRSLHRELSATLGVQLPTHADRGRVRARRPDARRRTRARRRGARGPDAGRGADHRAQELDL